MISLSSVSLGLLGHVVVLLLAVVDELDLVGVLAASHRLLSLLVGDEGLILLDVIDFAISETDVVPFVHASPHGRKDVGARDEEELGHVENVEELGAVADVEPHPVAVGLEALSFHAQ